MTRFTELELAALHSIFSETAELAPGLERQLATATVTERENSGAGFFTRIAVGGDAPAVNSPKVLGHETSARVAGLDDGLGFVLFMEQGRLHLLEGYANSPESTAALDLAHVSFEVYRHRLGPVG
jgi:hypothetical protein